jgi:hypothetical protein
MATRGLHSIDSSSTPFPSNGSHTEVPPVPSRTSTVQRLSHGLALTRDDAPEPEPTLPPVARILQRGGIGSLSPPSQHSTDMSLPEVQPGSPGVIDESALKDMLSPEKRAEMRKCLTEGEHIPRLSRRPISTYQPVDPATLEIYVLRLDRIYRLNHFLTHSNLNVPHVIDLATNGQVDRDSQDYKSLRTKLLEN